MTRIYKILTVVFAFVLLFGIGVYAFRPDSEVRIDCSSGSIIPESGSGCTGGFDKVSCPNTACTAGDTYCFLNGAGGQLCTCVGTSWTGPVSCGGKTSYCSMEGLGGVCKLA